MAIKAKLIQTQSAEENALPMARIQALNENTGELISDVDVATTARSVRFSDNETFQQKYDKGELKGLTGERGLTGQKGETGATGAKGENGKPGKDGENGENGADGLAATITIGSVIAAPLGTAAGVVNVGTQSAARLDFVVPTGSNDYNDLENKPVLQPVATTGSYHDLINKPTSLQANGGNADTIGNMTIAEIKDWTTEKMETGDNAVKTWATDKIEADDTAVKNWTTTQITTGDNAVKTWATSQITAGDNTVKTWATSQLEAGDTNVKNWTKNNISNPNLLIDGGFMHWDNGTMFNNTGGHFASYTATMWKATVVNTCSIEKGYDVVLGNTIKYSLGANVSYIHCYQLLEYPNITELKVTLSFWIKSSLTGAYTCVINGAGDHDKEIIHYTVDKANVWEKKTITYVVNVTANCIAVNICRRGSVIPSGTVIELAQPKLELGEVATPFVLTDDRDRIHYYYQKFGELCLTGQSNSLAKFITVNVPLFRNMRIKPVIKLVNMGWVRGEGKQIEDYDAVPQISTYSSGDSINMSITATVLAAYRAYSILLNKLHLDARL